MKLPVRHKTSVSGYNSRNFGQIETDIAVRVNLTLIRARCWCKVKVIGSKVKVKFIIC